MQQDHSVLIGHLDDVRTTCAEVAAQASSVHIDEARLRGYDVGPAIDDVDPGRMPFGTVDDTVAFVIALDAINFGSGWFPVLRKRDGMSGARSIAAAFRTNGAPSAEWLASVTTADCCELFDQDPSSEAAELMAHFATAWNDLGALLLDHYAGSATGLIDSADHSADRLVGLVRALPYFEDRRPYRGIDVAFYKRAQITASDLHAALGDEGPGRFDDLDRLTMFADNLVPHVLRIDGVLALEDALSARIDGGALLDVGSEEEVELRACAVHAVELLSDRTGRTPAELDTVLWNRGQGARYKAVPRPRCRTVSY